MTPAILDTLAFAPFPVHELRERALASRPEMDLWEGELGFIRRRVTGRDPSKPSIAVLPDGPATIESYDGFIEALRDRFNIAVVEIPGFGWSWPKRDAALGFETSCELIADALAELALPRLTLVGPCVQALHAARVAEMRPGVVHALILAQSGSCAAERKWAKVLDPQGVLGIPYQGQIAFRLSRGRASLDWWVPFAAGPKTPVEDLQTTGREVQGAGCGYALASQLQDMNNFRDSRPSQPAAVIWGMADASHRDTDHRSALELVPDAAYSEHAELGHFPDLEDPELIAKTALKLLG